MEKELKIFIRILADHLNKRKTIIEENVEWKKIISYAEIHQVEGIIFYQCNRMIPQELAERNNVKYASQVFYYVNRKKMMDEIEK